MGSTMKVIFMGTPEFAVPTLQTLINSEHIVSAVFTQSPKAKGRGLYNISSPIEQLARKYDIPIYTPKTLRAIEAHTLINSIEADVIVVVAYGFIIPKEILHAKRYGCLNIHPSLLPKYRGAAPLQHTIINGETESGVCIIQMDEGIDTGDIILQKQTTLNSRITLPELHNTYAHIGAYLLLEVLNNITLPRIKQSAIGASYANKLSKQDGKINWNDSAYHIDCKIRGMNPWPGTYFEYQNKIIKVLEAEYETANHNVLPGTVIDNNKVLKIACNPGILSIKKLQQPGKKALAISEFLLGLKIDGIVQ